MADFRHSIAVVIGIDDYRNGIPPLRTAVNDAVRLAAILEEEHNYEVELLVEEVTRTRLEALFAGTLKAQAGDRDRLLVYFAGHGIALDGDDGPAGFLIPQDARPEDRNSFLPMTELHAWLDALACRHLLAILDCCFAGAFRWASTRDLLPIPDVIHQERYDRFIRDPAWQVLTSAAYDQKALDVLSDVGSGALFGERGEREAHSPFALALYEALAGAGDLVPAGEGDGVITATELYLYLRDSVEVKAEEQARHRQTPGLWPLRKHDKGEYILLVPGHELNLPPAPELTYDNNPYRGLKSYDEKHGPLFFGRDDEIEDLSGLVAGRALTAVLGASGTGKSSLVKAGLLPRLRYGENGNWTILPPLRPTATPLLALHNLLAAQLDVPGAESSQAALRTNPGYLDEVVSAWHGQNPGQKLLLVVDQLEELVTLCRDAGERAHFLAVLAGAVQGQPEAFRLVVTLRTDFEPQLAEGTALEALWEDGRYVVPPMDHDDLRDVIEGPASVRVLYFQPSELVDELITEVIQTPGALPLLSFTLSELYIKYLRRQTVARRAGLVIERSLNQDDYEELGGVVGSLRNRATKEYERLPDKAHRQTMQRVMVRMVAVEGGELARRRVPRSELVYLREAENEQVETVIQRLVDARLVVEGREQDGEAYVEPAHDALVRAWDKLLTWRGEAEEYLPLQRQVAQAAREWDQADATARTGLLWNNNPRLPQLQEELALEAAPRSGMRNLLYRVRQVLWPNTAIVSRQTWLNWREIKFVRASITRRAQVLRRAVGIALAVFVALSVLTTVALLQWNAALKAQAEAEQQARVSRAGQLSLQAQDAIGQRPQRSLLLALEALDVTRQHGESRIPDAEQALRDALANTGGWGLTGHENSIPSVAISSDGHWLATASHDNTARLWDLSADDPNSASAVLAGHQIYLNDVAISPDNRWLVTASADGTARVWDLTALDPAAAPLILDGHEEGIETIAVSPDSRWLATGGEDGTLYLWDLATREPGARPIVLPAHVDWVSELAFSADGHWLASAGRDGFVLLWDVSTLLDTGLAGDAPGIPTAVYNGDSDYATVAISPDSRWMVASDFDGTAYLWDLSAGEPMENTVILEGHEEAIVDTAISPDSRWLATTGWDGTVRLWDLTAADPGAASAVLTGHEGGIDAVAFSPDERWLVSGGDDATARLWDISTLIESGRLAAAPRTESAILTGHDDGITRLAISTDSHWLVTASQDSSARLWPLSSEEMKAQPLALPVSEEEAEQMAISSDGRWLVTSSGGYTIDRWELPADGEFAEPITLAWLETPMEMLAISADSQRLVTVHDDGAVNLWDLTASPEAKPIPLARDEDGTPTVALSSENRWLAIADGENGIGLWDLTAPDPNSDPTMTIAHDEPVDAMALSPGADWLVAAKLDSAAHVWDMSGPVAATAVLTAPERLGSDLALSDDGRRLISVVGNAFSGDTVLRWDLAEPDQGPERFFLRGTAPGTTLVLSPDARWLARAYLDGSVSLWDLTAAHPGVPSARHAGTARDDMLAISADGTRLAVGSGGAIHLWDLTAPDPSDGAIVLGTPDPIVKASIINAITISPDGAWLAASSERGKVHLWSLHLDGLLDLACRTAGRNLSKEEWEQFFPGEVYRATCADVRIGAEEALAQADGLARSGDVNAAPGAYAQAVDLVLEGSSARLSNLVCWHGSLYGFAEIVLPACEHAVTLQPEEGSYRDSRGLARASLADLEGALEDFEAYLTQLKSGRSVGTDYTQQQREAWIEALQAGQNPFDEATLEALRNELR